MGVSDHNDGVLQTGKHERELHDLEVRLPSEAADWAAASLLLSQYFEWLAPIAGVSSVPEVQTGAKAELEDMASVYALPRTHLKLASWKGSDVGMIGVKPHDQDTAEIVRFFTVPAARKVGAGSVLLRSAVESAEGFGYRAIVLDTLPNAMAAAVRLYERCGFVATDEPHALPVAAGQRFRLAL